MLDDRTTIEISASVATTTTTRLAVAVAEQSSFMMSPSSIPALFLRLFERLTGITDGLRMCTTGLLRFWRIEGRGVDLSDFRFHVSWWRWMGGGGRVVGRGG